MEEEPPGHCKESRDIVSHDLRVEMELLTSALALAIF